MSAFGDGTFKEDILYYIKSLSSDRGMRKPEMMVELLDVVRYLADEVYRDIRNELAKEAQEMVKQSLIKKLKEN